MSNKLSIQPADDLQESTGSGTKKSEKLAQKRLGVPVTIGADGTLAAELPADISGKQINAMRRLIEPGRRGS